MRNANNFLLVILPVIFCATNALARDSFSIGINVGGFDSYHSSSQQQIIEYHDLAPIEHYAPIIHYYSPPVIHRETVHQHYLAPNIIYQYTNNGQSLHQHNHFENNRYNNQNHFERSNRDQRWSPARDNYVDGNNGRNFRGYTNRDNSQGYNSQGYNSPRNHPHGHNPQVHNPQVHNPQAHNPQAHNPHGNYR